ncbi:hypothetical protein Q5530_34735 [Saccharothrix sp. BKS2]|uniref:hypothetical protein n=1 Tax=Saccharothrix sp. BKS2 TaxID=3064400 RepID=UPI0039EC424E
MARTRPEDQDLAAHAPAGPRARRHVDEPTRTAPPRSAGHVIGLQRAAGNAAVSRLVTWAPPVQRLPSDDVENAEANQKYVRDTAHPGVQSGMSIAHRDNRRPGPKSYRKADLSATLAQVEKILNEMELVHATTVRVIDVRVSDEVDDSERITVKAVFVDATGRWKAEVG